MNKIHIFSLIIFLTFCNVSKASNDDWSLLVNVAGDKYYIKKSSIIVNITKSGYHTVSGVLNKIHNSSGLSRIDWVSVKLDDCAYGDGTLTTSDMSGNTISVEDFSIGVDNVPSIISKVLCEVKNRTEYNR